MGFFDDLKKTVSNALGVDAPANHASETITFADIPTSAEAIRALPIGNLQSPYATAALCICALNVFVTNQEAGVEMMNYLKGPDAMSPMDISFIRDRFQGDKTYKVRSYFNGATPDNNYMPASPYTVTVTENAHSRDNYADGYLVVFLKSGGADSPRPLTLRRKPSTGEWFVFSDSFKGLLADIRIPKAQDPWA